MYKSFILLALVISLLAGCVPPSRSYTKQPRNVNILKADALNIDHVKPIKVEVEASRSWQNTGVFLENGEVANITANGSWSPAPALLAWSGPEGNSLWAVEVPGIPGGALMAKLGHDGHPFEIGTTQTFSAQDYGMLYLAMNDPFRYLYDNSGKVTAEIHLQVARNTDNTNKRSSLEIVSYEYDDQTGKGSLAARIDSNPFATRQHLINKIGEIASSKNVAIQAGNEPVKGGNFELLDESSNDGVLVMKFKTLW